MNLKDDSETLDDKITRVISNAAEAARAEIERLGQESLRDVAALKELAAHGPDSLFSRSAVVLVRDLLPMHNVDHQTYVNLRINGYDSELGQFRGNTLKTQTLYRVFLFIEEVRT